MRRAKERMKANDDEAEDHESESEESDEDDDDDNLTKKIPTSHEVQLNHGDRAITSLAIDPSGSRLISGGIDFGPGKQRYISSILEYYNQVQLFSIITSVS